MATTPANEDVRGYVETEKSEILVKLQQYYFESEDFVDFLEDWCRDNAHKVASRVIECRLEYSYLHRDFLRDFEDKLTHFIDRHGGKVQDVMAELAEAPRDSDLDLFAQILNATTDFEVFIQMMSETARRMLENRTGKTS